MILRAVFLFFFALSFQICLAQTNDSVSKKSFKKLIRPGFNYHLQISHLDIAPFVGIALTDRIQTGAGLNYLYHYRNSIRKGKSSFGFNLFSKVFITPRIFTHVEYLYSDVAYLNQLIYEYTRVRKADLFIGGGYIQPLSDNLVCYLMALYNINHSNESPYKNRVLIKAGIMF